VAVKVVVSVVPGASEVMGPPVTVVRLSSTVMLVRVTLPVFSTVKV